MRVRRRGGQLDLVRPPWTLNTGDCLGPEGLATLGPRSVDHVITDPPYSERCHSRFSREERNDGIAPRRKIAFASITPEQMTGLAVEACRVARRWILIFCDEVSVAGWVREIEAAGGTFVRRGIWVKAGPMPQMSGDRPGSGVEDIVLCHAPCAKRSGRMRWNGGGRAAVWSVDAREDRGSGPGRRHQTQKPIALMEALVRDFTDHGDTILDPFAGSGSTGVAAVRCGRQFVGWELDPACADVAHDRLGAAREQLSLERIRTTKTEQPGLFVGKTGVNGVNGG